MSAYLSISLVFLAIAAVGSLLAIRSARRRPSPLGMIVTVIVLLVLTAVFDNLMIAGGLFHYAPDLLSGLRIGLAPIEDFAYPLAGAILLPAVWALLRSRRGAPTDATAEEDAR